MHALSITCLKLLEPLFHQEEARLARLLSAWASLIGDPFSTCSLPEKWQALPHQSAVLYLRVWNGLAFEMSHEHDRWRDRINQFFGYKAISRLVFRQSEAPHTSNTPPLEDPSSSPRLPPQSTSPPSSSAEITLVNLLRHGSSTLSSPAICSPDSGTSPQDTQIPIPTFPSGSLSHLDMNTPFLPQPHHAGLTSESCNVFPLPEPLFLALCRLESALM